MPHPQVSKHALLPSPNTHMASETHPIPTPNTHLGIPKMYTNWVYCTSKLCTHHQTYILTVTGPTCIQGLGHLVMCVMLRTSVATILLFHAQYEFVCELMQICTALATTQLRMYRRQEKKSSDWAQVWDLPTVHSYAKFQPRKLSITVMIPHLQSPLCNGHGCATVWDCLRPTPSGVGTSAVWW